MSSANRFRRQAAEPRGVVFSGAAFETPEGIQQSRPWAAARPRRHDASALAVVVDVLRRGGDRRGAADSLDRARQPHSRGAFFRVGAWLVTKTGTDRVVLVQEHGTLHSPARHRVARSRAMGRFRPTALRPPLPPGLHRAEPVPHRAANLGQQQGAHLLVRRGRAAGGTRPRAFVASRSGRTSRRARSVRVADRRGRPRRVARSVWSEHRHWSSTRMPSASRSSCATRRRATPSSSARRRRVPPCSSPEGSRCWDIRPV